MVAHADRPASDVGAAVPLRADVRDLLVVAVTILAAVTVMLASREAVVRDADALGVVLLVGAGAPLVVRRRWPVAVLAAVVAVTYLYLVLGYPGGAELPLLMAALYTAVAEGHRVAALVALVVTAGSALVYRLAVDGDDVLRVVVTVSLLILITLLGDAVHSRRRLLTEVRRRLETLAAEQELETRTRLTAERLRIGRELHDVLAHTITAITVQAGAAADGFEEGSDARRALRTMRATAQDAMAQLRATVAVLRSDEDLPRHVAPRLADLPELVGSLADAGVHADVTIVGEAHELPAVVELTGYRIVQEAVTNIIRHSAAEHARVELAYGDRALTVTVEDDGGQPSAGTSTDADDAGFGVIGMRERAQAIGGQVTAGPVGSGFRVRAVLPVVEVP